MTNIKSNAGFENQDKKLRIEVPKAPDNKSDQYLIGIIRKGLHDHYIDVEFITRKCLEEGLVKIIDEPNTIEATDKGKKFVKQYDSIILNEADFKIMQKEYYKVDGGRLTTDAMLDIMRDVWEQLLDIPEGDHKRRYI